MKEIRDQLFRLNNSVHKSSDTRDLRIFLSLNRCWYKLESLAYNAFKAEKNLCCPFILAVFIKKKIFSSFWFDLFLFFCV